MTESLKVELTRVFKAERRKVFEAWTNPGVLKRWLAPHDTMMSEATADVKIGGAFRIDMAGKIEGRDITGYASGVYREVVPDERLSFTWTWHNVGTGEVTGETLVTVTFKEKDGGTEMTLVHDKFATPEMQQDYKFGWISCFDKLARIVA